MPFAEALKEKWRPNERILAMSPPVSAAGSATLAGAYLRAKQVAWRARR